MKAVKVVEAASPSPLGTIEIKLGKGNVHIAGRVDLVVLRTALGQPANRVDQRLPRR